MELRARGTDGARRRHISHGLNVAVVACCLLLVLSSVHVAGQAPPSSEHQKRSADSQRKCYHRVCLYIHGYQLATNHRYSGYFAAGQVTREIGSPTGILPQCSVHRGRHSQRRLPVTLQRISSGLVHGGAAGEVPVRLGFARFNTLAFPVLTPSLAGVYQCKSGWRRSVDIYALNVVVPPQVTLTRNAVVDVGSKELVICNATGSPMPDVTIAIMGTSISVTNTSVARLVYSVNETARAGQQVMTVVCTARLPAFTCTADPRHPAVKRRCDAIARTATVKGMVHIHGGQQSLDAPGPHLIFHIGHHIREPTVEARPRPTSGGGLSVGAVVAIGVVAGMLVGVGATVALYKSKRTLNIPRGRWQNSTVHRSRGSSAAGHVQAQKPRHSLAHTFQAISLYSPPTGRKTGGRRYSKLT